MSNIALIARFNCLERIYEMLKAVKKMLKKKATATRENSLREPTE
jgi:hypothetical protein